MVATWKEGMEVRCGSALQMLLAEYMLSCFLAKGWTVYINSFSRAMPIITVHMLCSVFCDDVDGGGRLRWLHDVPYMCCYCIHMRMVCRGWRVHRGSCFRGLSNSWAYLGVRPTLVWLRVSRLQPMPRALWPGTPRRSWSLPSPSKT